MKKLWMGVFFYFILISNLNAGSKIFDLKNQYFSETLIETKGQNSEHCYDVGEVNVTTNTGYKNGRYFKGLFIVDIKQPLKNWTVNISKKNGAYRQGSSSSLRVVSDSGKSYFITINVVDNYLNGEVLINDNKSQKINVKNKTFNYSIEKDQTKTIISIAGVTKVKLDSKEFGNLSKIEIQLNVYQNSYDELLSLDIYKAD